MQEVFIKVYRAKLPAEETFLAWFYRIILNTGRDAGRRRKTRLGLMDKLQRVSSDFSVDPPSDPADPALREALAALSPELRECVALRFFADLPLDEIAAVQGIPVGTVKSRLHGAMRQLKRSLTAAAAYTTDGEPVVPESETVVDG